MLKKHFIFAGFLFFIFSSCQDLYRPKLVRSLLYDGLKINFDTLNYRRSISSKEGKLYLSSEEIDLYKRLVRERSLLRDCSYSRKNSRCLALCFGWFTDILCGVVDVFLFI